MSSFRDLLKVPGVLRIVLSQLYARLPFGMLSLAFIIFIQEKTGSYTIAGIALGAETLGVSVAQPILSRIMANFGIRPVIIISSAVTSVAFLAMTVVPPEPLILILLSLVIGLSSPPIQTAARVIYPNITPKPLLVRLFGLDATAQEIIWVVGPVVITLIAAQFGNDAMLYTMAVVQVTGTLWFVWNSETKTKVSLSETPLGKVLKNKTVSIMTFMGLLFIGSFAGIEVASVAVFDKALAGLLIAVFSIGSILGGVFLASRGKGKWALSKFVFLVLVGFSMVLIDPTNPWWVGFSLFIAGIGVAPTLGIMALTISGGTKKSETAEAFGWQTTGQLVGLSAGSALAGVAVDTISPVAAFITSVIFGIGTLMAAIISANYLTPPGQITHPETAPIKTIDE